MPLMPEAKAQPTKPPPHWSENPLTQFIPIGATAGWGAFALPDMRPSVRSRYLYGSKSLFVWTIRRRPAFCTTSTTSSAIGSHSV